MATIAPWYHEAHSSLQPWVPRRILEESLHKRFWQRARLFDLSQRGVSYQLNLNRIQWEIKHEYWRDSCRYCSTLTALTYRMEVNYRESLPRLEKIWRPGPSSGGRPIDTCILALCAVTTAEAVPQRLLRVTDH